MEAIEAGERVCMELLLSETETRFLGYSYDDYVNMFDLKPHELHSMRFLDYAGALNGFTSTMMRDNLKSTCVDPLYSIPKVQLEGKIELACLNFKNYLEQHFDDLCIDEDKIEETVQQKRLVALRTLESYDAGKNSGCFKEQALPSLELEDNSYDMALCSHLLFTYGDVLSEQFHIDSILELARVAYQVRVFPLVCETGKLSDHIGPVLQTLQEKGYKSEIRQVSHKFQKIGNAMLVIDSSQCDIREDTA